MLEVKPEAVIADKQPHLKRPTRPAPKPPTEEVTAPPIPPRKPPPYRQEGRNTHQIEVDNILKRSI
jgi:hypothetical protein